MFVSNEINLFPISLFIWEEGNTLVGLFVLEQLIINPMGTFCNIILVLGFIFPFYVIGFLIIVEHGKKPRCIKQYPVVY